MSPQANNVKLLNHLSGFGVLLCLKTPFLDFFVDIPIIDLELVHSDFIEKDDLHSCRDQSLSFLCSFSL